MRDEPADARGVLPGVRRAVGRVRGYTLEPMTDPQIQLEYAFKEPAPEVAFSVVRFAALGYVAACVVGLIIMGVAMAMQV